MNTSILAHPLSTIKPEFVTPYLLGRHEAEEGSFCLPELYFVRHVEQCEYARGYESVAGCTLLSAQVLGYASKYPRLLTDEEAQAELNDYTDDMLDREFHARGQW